jgi:hypothetical protein
VPRTTRAVPLHSECPSTAAKGSRPTIGVHALANASAPGGRGRGRDDCRLWVDGRPASRPHHAFEGLPLTAIAGPPPPVFVPYGECEYEVSEEEGYAARRRSGSKPGRSRTLRSTGLDAHAGESQCAGSRARSTGLASTPTSSSTAATRRSASPPTRPDGPSERPRRFGRWKPSVPPPRTCPRRRSTRARARPLLLGGGIAGPGRRQAHTPTFVSMAREARDDEAAQALRPDHQGSSHHHWRPPRFGR